MPLKSPKKEANAALAVLPSALVGVNADIMDKAQIILDKVFHNFLFLFS